MPEERKLARKLVMERSRFDIIDGILYYGNPDVEGKWKIAVPICWRELLIQEVHDGQFGGHFTERRIYEQLHKYYWWDKMRADVRRYSLVCASRSGQGRVLRLPLKPIPVDGPFPCIGVNLLQLPLTYEGNQYAIVFMDYLTKWPEVFPSPDQKAETIARLLVEHIVVQHGVPEQLLSDRGLTFLSAKKYASFLGWRRLILRDTTHRLTVSSNVSIGLSKLLPSGVEGLTRIARKRGFLWSTPGLIPDKQIIHCK